MGVIKKTEESDYYIGIAKTIKNNPNMSDNQLIRILKKVAKDGWQDGYNHHLENC